MLFNNIHSASGLRRALGIAVCIALICGIAFSSVCVLLAHDHDCCGEGCPVCALLQQYQDIIRQLRHVVTLLALMFVPQLIIHISYDRADAFQGADTLVSRCVQLND